MAEGKKLHVAMFPWLAFGHMITYLDLAKFIAQKGHKVSFLSTPRNIDRLPELPPDLASLISVVKIPLPKISKLPEGAESTADIRGEEMNYLEKAFDGMEFEINRFLECSAPDWIIFDFAPYWLPPVAARLGISRALFVTINAWFVAFLRPLNSGSDDRTMPEDFMVPPKWVKFETKVAYRRFEAEWVLRATQSNESGVSDFYRSGAVIEGSEAIVLRHCYEFEPQWLNLLEEFYHRPVIPVGLMPPEVHENSKDENDGTWVMIKNWLDDKSKSSVVYVALGSEVNPSQAQLTELALGLELSGVAFFWVVRRVSSSDSMEIPSGFEERIKGRGIVWRSWAPQLKILSHDSVGGFLTHCGWGSVVEGLMFGHPLITLPFLVDQGLNSRVIVDKLLGVEIQRNQRDGTYTRNSVAESVKLVMVEDEGNKFRDKAREASVIFGDRELHHSYIDNFVTYLENHTRISRS